VITLLEPRGFSPIVSVFQARCDIGCGGTAHIDLSACGAAAYGVAPSHAFFYAADDALYTEAAETPGAITRINGVAMTPGRLYLLRHGDELELCRLRLTARLFVVKP
jgi:hypothetical protein